jgi:hypothetical protein
MKFCLQLTGSTEIHWEFLVFGVRNALPHLQVISLIMISIINKINISQHLKVIEYLQLCKPAVFENIQLPIT